MTNNTTNDDTKGVVARTRIDFEIDVDAICAIARSSREWLVDVKGKEKEEE